MQVSQFQPFAVGIAAENKELRSKILKVVPHEHLPFLDGELKENPTPLGFKGVDADGNAYEGQVFADNVVEAEWWQEGGAGISAPDVRRGERIILYRFGDADKYYWRPWGDNHLRRLETKIFAISATQDESTTALTPENSYFLELSSHTKRITLQTSQANGESVSYFLRLDMGTGEITLDDNVGNSFYLKSLEGFLRLLNTQMSHFILDKRKISLKADEEISLEVGGTKQVWKPSETSLHTPKYRGTS